MIGPAGSGDGNGWGGDGGLGGGFGGGIGGGGGGGIGEGRAGGHGGGSGGGGSSGGGGGGGDGQHSNGSADFEHFSATASYVHMKCAPAALAMKETWQTCGLSLRSELPRTSTSNTVNAGHRSGHAREGTEFRGAQRTTSQSVPGDGRAHRPRRGVAAAATSRCPDTPTRRRRRRFRPPVFCTWQTVCPRASCSRTAVQRAGVSLPSTCLVKEAGSANGTSGSSQHCSSTHLPQDSAHARGAAGGGSGRGGMTGEGTSGGAGVLGGVGGGGDGSHRSGQIQPFP